MQIGKNNETRPDTRPEDAAPGGRSPSPVPSLRSYRLKPGISSVLTKMAWTDRRTDTLSYRDA